MEQLAIIGGTGLTEIPGLEIVRRQVMHTPYGEPSGVLTIGKLYGREIAFLARHGYSHSIPPHMINYRANIWALKNHGITHIVAFAVTGGIRADMTPPAIVIPHQIIDYTYGRQQTFFEKDLREVRHIDFSQPYCPALRARLVAAAEKAGVASINEGVYAAMQGPRLETAAEIDKLERDGCDIVGMTGMPEAALAKELGLSYATISVVANLAAGRGDEEITMDAIRANVAEGMKDGAKILQALFSRRDNERKTP